MDATRWPDRFLGGAICLDFINTIERFESRHQEDRFTDYGAILRWSITRGTMLPDALGRLHKFARRDPNGAAQVWRCAIELRRVLRELMIALMSGQPSEGALERLNRRFADLPPAPAMAYKAGAFHYQLSGEALEEPLWPVLWSAAGLLTEKQTERLGECQAESCRYLFLDLSRNKSRRWCSSESCGNRERVRRAYRAEKIEADL